MPSSRPLAKTFDAVLERSGNSLNWTIIRIPLDIAKLWGVRGQLRVQGEINGFAFRTSLFPDGKGAHFMIVNKKMQAGGKVVPGGCARFRLEPDTVRREVTVPEEWIAVLRESKALRRYYESLSSSTQRDIAKWVGEPKGSEARSRRAEQIAERLLLTMEAERELPPLLQVAMAQNPKARAGWERMPRGLRRSHLLGIFYYREPQARARRTAKAVEAALAYADKPVRKNMSKERRH
jgi:uncharacterized protein YdeI (YjbR/CyaY-like superfamily)